MPAWKAALAVLALTGATMALSVQLFERRAREEEARLAAARLEHALAASRARLKAEILAELRAELAGRPAADEPGTGPIPGTILRRPEADGEDGLEQSLDPSRSREPSTPTRLSERVRELAAQMEEADRGLRRDLEESQAAVRRELDAAEKATSFLLLALIPLVVHLLAAAWPGRGEEDRRDPGAPL